MNYGRYQIIREVGRGSMGVVYQCRDPHIDRLVAVKVLRTDRVESENFVQRFLKEARVIGRLAHPNIVTIYDVGEEQGTVYIAMEFLEGTALSELMRANRPPLHDVIGLGVQLAEALDYAHQKGVVHRDVKPSNIVVQPDGQIRITDFGIAHVDDSTATLQTQAGEIMGTPAYMSPEQVLSQPVDARSDIFSLGIILYELTTGRRPFGGESKSLVTVFNDIVDLTPPEPMSLSAAIPEELSRIVMKALDKEPAKRFQSGKELAEALKGAMAAPAATQPGAAGAPQESFNKDGAKPMTVGTTGAGKNAIAAGAAVMVAALLGGAFFFASGKSGLHESLTLAKPEGGAPYAAVPKIPDAAEAPPGAAVDATQHVPAGSSAAASSYQPVPSNVTGGSSVQDSATPVPATVTSPKAASPLRASPLRASLAPKSGESLPRSVAKPVTAATMPDKKSVKAKVQAKAPAKEEPPRTPKHEPRVKNAPPGASATSSGGAGHNAAAISVTSVAFLNVETTPPGARIYINGEAKGTTPRIVKLNLGQYRVRLARPGYQEIEKTVSLDHVQEYPVSEVLTRAE